MCIYWVVNGCNSLLFVLHIFTQVFFFLVGNLSNLKNWVPFMIFHNLCLIWMGMRKKNKISGFKRYFFFKSTNVQFSILKILNNIKLKAFKWHLGMVWLNLLYVRNYDPLLITNYSMILTCTGVSRKSSLAIANSSCCVTCSLRRIGAVIWTCYTCGIYNKFTHYLGARIFKDKNLIG